MKIIVLAGILVSSVAFGAVKTTVVYRVNGVTPAGPRGGWATLSTVNGTRIGVLCKTRQFDDSEHDRVAGFDSESECLEFLATIAKHASTANPVEVEIADDLSIRMKISY
jgi:hypothetical protein